MGGLNINISLTVKAAIVFPCGLYLYSSAPQNPTLTIQAPILSPLQQAYCQRPQSPLLAQLGF